MDFRIFYLQLVLIVFGTFVKAAPTGNQKMGGLELGKQFSKPIFRHEHVNEGDEWFNAKQGINDVRESPISRDVKFYLSLLQPMKNFHPPSTYMNSGSEEYDDDDDQAVISLFPTKEELLQLKKGQGHSPDKRKIKNDNEKEAFLKSFKKILVGT